MMEKNQTKSWTLLRGLRPFTTYRFRLSAWNQLGEGQVSDTSNNVTLPEESKEDRFLKITDIELRPSSQWDSEIGHGRPS